MQFSIKPVVHFNFKVFLITSFALKYVCAVGTVYCSRIFKTLYIVTVIEKVAKNYVNKFIIICDDTIF